MTKISDVKQVHIFIGIWEKYTMYENPQCAVAVVELKNGIKKVIKTPIVYDNSYTMVLGRIARELRVGYFKFIQNYNGDFFRIRGTKDFKRKRDLLAWQKSFNEEVK